MAANSSGIPEGRSNKLLVNESSMDGTTLRLKYLMRIGAKADDRLGCVTFDIDLESLDNVRGSKNIQGLNDIVTFVFNRAAMSFEEYKGDYRP
jgi:hypothetical protein